MLAGGLLLRGVPSTGMLVAGTVVGMSGLAMCNVAMPSFIRGAFRGPDVADDGSVHDDDDHRSHRHRCPDRADGPAARLALGRGSGSIGILALAACLGFLPIALHAHRHAPAVKATHVSPWPLLRTRTGLMITAGFTLQALLAYSVLSWFPYMLATMGSAPPKAG